MTTRSQRNRAPNSGSISRNPSGSFRAQVSLPGGTRITRSFPTKKDADGWIREMRTQVDVGLAASNHKVTMQEYLEGWLERRERKLRPQTFAEYNRNCRKVIFPMLGQKKLREIKLHMVNEFYSRLARDGTTNMSIRLLHRVLHAAMEDAVRQGYIAFNPAHRADIPARKDAHDSMKIFSPEEHRRFLEGCASARHGTLYILAIMTGMRQGELLGLTWDNVNLERGEIRIIQQLSRFNPLPGQRFALAPLKTRYSARTIKIGAKLIVLLSQQHDRQQESKAVTGSRWKEHNLVFTSSLGTPLDQRNMQIDFDAMLKAAGLPKIRFHDLRHNAASLMLASGQSVVLVSRYLGHSSSQVTLEVYAHLLPGGFEEVGLAMDQVFNIEVEKMA